MYKLVSVLALLSIIGCTSPEPVGEAPKPQGKLRDNGYDYIDKEVEGMTYRVYYNTFARTGASVYVTNVTKEKLEVQLLRQQLGLPVEGKK